MKSKAARYLLIAIVSLLVAFVSTLVAGAVNSWSSTSAPPPPTPGHPPVSVSDTAPRGNPVTNRGEAIRRALSLDSKWTIREQPLTEERITANLDMVIVEPYATRQEAADAYWGDGFNDPEIASEPVWVVIIKGKASVKAVGGLGAQEFVEADGVTYVISQKTGLLLRVSTGIPQKRSDDHHKD
jgi:hypothetical protein